MSVAYGIGIEEHDQEGRVITLEFAEFYLVTVYTPNSQSELARLDYRMRWEDAFLSYLKGLEEKKPIVFCGDLNVAHKEIDLKNPKPTEKMPVLRMRNAENFLHCWDRDLSTPIAIFIRIRKESIPGGLIVSRQGRKMPDGVLIISVSRKV